MNKPWWSEKWGKEAICGITLTRLRPGKNKQGVEYVSKLECGHRFYTSALINWIATFSEKPTCPTCRNRIDKLRYANYNLYFN